MKKLAFILALAFAQPVGAAPTPVLQTGHGTYVYSLAVSPNSRFYATGDDDGTVLVGDLLRHQIVARFIGPGRVTALQFAPGAKRLLVGREDGTTFYDLGTQTVVWRDAQRGREFQFSPDGARVTTVGREKVVRATATGQVLKRQEFQRFDNSDEVALSPNGKLAATNNYGLIVDTVSGQIRHVLKGVRGHIWALQFSPDGQKLFTFGSSDGGENGSKNLVGQFWNVQTWKLERTVPLFDDSYAFMRCMSWSPDSRKIAIAGEVKKNYDQINTLKIVDAATGRVLRTRSDATRLLERNAPVWVSPSRVLMTTVQSGPDAPRRFGVEEYDVATNKGQIFGSQKRLLRMETPTFSPDGRFLVARSPLANSSGATLRIWDLKNGRMSQPPWGKEPERGVDSPFGRLMAGEGNFAPGANIAFWRWTPDGKTLVTDGLAAWGWPDGPLVRKYQAPPLPDGGWKPMMKPPEKAAFEAKIRAAWNDPKRLPGSVRFLEIAPDNRTCVVGTMNSALAYSGTDPGPGGALALWDISSGEIRVLENDVDVYALRLSPDGALAAVTVSPPAGSKSGQKPASQRPFLTEKRGPARLEIWDIQRGVRRRVRPDETRWGNGLLGWRDATHALLQRDATQGKSLQSWDATTGAVTPFEASSLTSLIRTDEGVPLLWLAEDGVLRVSNGQKVRYFDLKTERELVTPPTSGEAGRFDLVAVGDGTMQLWRRAEKPALLATVALFPALQAGQGPQWFAWTPEGLWDGSPGAEANVVWRENGVLRAEPPQGHRLGLLAQLAP
jgi:WD40 repeat protein